MERLYIKNIQHSKLPASFSFLKKLKELHLDGLDLTDKGTDFSNFKELQKLKISSCKIDSTVIFSGLKKLETLYLTYGLNKIVEIGSLTNLKSLTLFESKITDWKEGFKSLSELKKLKELSIINIKCNEIPDEIGLLKGLKILDLSATRTHYDQNILTLPDSFCDLQNLEKLVLSKQRILKLPSNFGNLKKLKFLEFSETKIVYLPDSFGLLRKLESVNFFKCELKRLPENLELFNLKTLNLTETPLETIPQSLGNSTKLQVLLVSRCSQLSFMSPINIDFIVKLKKLVLLELSQLGFKSIPNEIANLKMLKSVKMRHNNITVIPPRFYELTNLEFLTLDHNNIKDFAEGIGNLKKLIYLSACDNYLKRFPLDFYSLPNLEIIKLSNNCINNFKWNRGQLKNLKELWLSHNRLRSFSPELRYLNSLSELRLARNYIRELPIEAILKAKCLTRMTITTEGLTKSQIAEIHELLGEKVKYLKVWN